MMFCKKNMASLVALLYTSIQAIIINKNNNIKLTINQFKANYIR